MTGVDGGLVEEMVQRLDMVWMPYTTMGLMQGLCGGELTKSMTCWRKLRSIFILKMHSMRAMIGRKMNTVRKTTTLATTMGG